MARYERQNIRVQTVLLCTSEVNSCGEVHIYDIQNCPVLLADRNLSSMSIPAKPKVICNDKITYLSKYL
jgi:hypothetical protein